MNAVAEPDKSTSSASPAQEPLYKRINIPTPRRNSIHTLGRGSISKINAKYSANSPSPTKNNNTTNSEIDSKEDSGDREVTAGDGRGGGDNSNGNITDNNTTNNEGEMIKNENDDEIAQHCNTAQLAISTMSNIKIDCSDDGESPKKSFNAIVSKFGGGTFIKPKTTENGVASQNQDDSAATKKKTHPPDLSTPKATIHSMSKTFPSFLKSSSSGKKTKSNDQSEFNNNLASGGGPDLSLPSSSSVSPLPSHHDNGNSSGSSAQNNKKKKSSNITSGLKKISQSLLSPSSQTQNQSAATPPPSRNSTNSSNNQRPGKNNKNQATTKKKPLSALPPGPQSSRPTSTKKKQHTNMVQPKSHQRLVLEQVAAQYFLNESKTTHGNNSSTKYIGITSYGDEGECSTNNGLGNIDEQSNVSNIGAPNSKKSGINRDRLDIIALLENTRNSSSSIEDAKDLSIINEVASVTSSCSRTSGGSSNIGSKLNDTVDSTSSGENNRTAISGQNNIQREKNIDKILELASDHLSLGKNDLALQAYRRAMKLAFDDVIRVKRKLVEVKVRQANDNLDVTAAELTKQEEQQFELSLLQVASRVADIHNNMGVVFEMNRQYSSAKAAYIDALEVYHNTCKRFEEKGDPDVVRTKMNVERMTLACNSEKDRNAYHLNATQLAQRVASERNFTKRQSLLQGAVSQLQKALELEGETIGLSHPVAAHTLISMGKYHYEMREYDLAVAEIRRAITILRSALGIRHPQVGKSTLLLASIYERHGLHISPEGVSKDDSELELYVDALEPLKATLGDIHPEVALLYSKVGHLYGKKNDPRLSLLAYKASLKAYGEPSSSSSFTNPEIVSIWVRVTEHLSSLKLYQDTVVAGSRALFLLRQTKDALFRDAQFATSSNGVSNGTNNRRSQYQITSDTYYESLFMTLQSLTQAHTSLTNYALARDAGSESLLLAWDMALSVSSSSNSRGSTNNNQELQVSILRIIRALKRIGKTFLLQKHYTPALECFLPSLELLRSSTEMETTLDCASVLGSLGFLYLKLQKFTEASNFLRECIRLYQMNGKFGCFSCVKLMPYQSDNPIICFVYSPILGVAPNDRETRKVHAWLEMAEAHEDEEGGRTPPLCLEIPTIVFSDETS